MINKEVKQNNEQEILEKISPLQASSKAFDLSFKKFTEKLKLAGVITLPNIASILLTVAIIKKNPEGFTQHLNALLNEALVANPLSAGVRTEGIALIFTTYFLTFLIDGIGLSFSIAKLKKIISSKILQHGN